MGLHKTLREGETIAIDGACVITARKSCDIDIEADAAVNIGTLKWERGEESGCLCAKGNGGQGYIIYNDGASLYTSIEGKLTEFPIYKGDRPKQFCEIHNMQWGE